MTDTVDVANESAQFATDLALHQHRSVRRLPPQVYVGGSVLCMDCEFAIPSERLRAVPDCVRCIDCQVAYELEQRL